MKKYNWPSAIKSYLEASIQKLHNTPTNVTGCVIALLYWLCEHSLLMKPTRKKYIPRFMKWDLGKLTKALKDISLRSLESDKVYGGEIEFTRTKARKFNVKIETLGIGRERKSTDGDSNSSDNDSSTNEDKENENDIPTDEEAATKEESGDAHNEEVGVDEKDEKISDQDLQKAMESIEKLAHAALDEDATKEQTPSKHDDKDEFIAQLKSKIQALEKGGATKDGQIKNLELQTSSLSKKLVEVSKELVAKQEEYKALHQMHEEALRNMQHKQTDVDKDLNEETVEFNVHNITQAFQKCYSLAICRRFQLGPAKGHKAVADRRRHKRECS